MRRLVVVAALLVSSVSLAVPATLTHTGRLKDAAGVPLEGVHDLQVALYVDSAGGSPLWSGTLPATIEDGFFAIRLGEAQPLDPAIFTGNETLWVEIAVAGSPPMTRQAISAVPWAIASRSAFEVKGGVVDASEVRINGTTVIDASGAVSAPVSWSDIQGVPSTVSDGDGDTLGALGCQTGEIAAFDGLDWQCQPAAGHAHDAADLATGTIPVARLPVGSGENDVAAGDHTHDASAVTTGRFQVERIPDLDASKITSGAFGTAQIPDLDASKITSGAFGTAQIPDLDASKITSGAFGVAQIPSLDASKITTGTFAAAQIPNLNASKITAGTFAAAQIPSLDASKITTGTFAAAQIPNLDAAKITTGTIAYGRLPVGTIANTVAAGNHTHTAADVGALPIGGGTLTGNLRLGSNSTTCNSSTAGSIRWDGTDFLGCNGTIWVDLAAGGALGASAATAADSCASILTSRPGSPSGAYWLDTDGGAVQPPFEVWCDMTTEGGGWLDLVRTFHLGSNDATTLMNRFFVTNGVGGTKIRPGVANDLGTLEPGFYLDNYDYYAANHTQGFHFRPLGMSYTRVRLAYRMQGTQQTHNRCANSNWVPLNGPGYNGGLSAYLSPCLTGFSCIQGTPTDGRDAPIAATYSSDSLNSANTLLTWSGSTDEPLSNGCSRDVNIPTSHPTTWFTRFLVR